MAKTDVVIARASENNAGSQRVTETANKLVVTQNKSILLLRHTAATAANIFSQDL